MTQVNTSSGTNPSLPAKAPGFFTLLLWELPWRILGMLLVSLLFSLLVEYLGMTFIWPEEGAQHSRGVLLAESSYFADGFKQSLFLSTPVTTVQQWLTLGYQCLFLDSGFLDWVHATPKTATKPANEVSRQLRLWGAWLAAICYEYLMATVYITMIFLLRVIILVLSIPLFILVAIVGISDGMVRRDLRRYGAAYESSFLCHHAKRFVKPAACIPCVLYLSAPCTVYPNLFLLPAALLTGLAISVTMGSFKKYL